MLCGTANAEAAEDTEVRGAEAKTNAMGAMFFDAMYAMYFGLRHLGAGEARLMGRL